jgi:UDP-glucose 4-epimerase
VLLEGVEVIFHLAAQPGVRPSWGSTFASYVATNVLMTQRLLEAAKEHDLRKFVYVSSSSVYGDAESLPTPETATPKPLSPYGVTKLAGEHLALLYGRNFGLPVVAVRYFTVFGPRQRPDMAFNRFIEAIRNDEAITLFGDGQQTRDFTFVSDAVEGTVRAGLNPIRGEVFNIGGGSRTTINAVIDSLGRLMGKNPLIEHRPSQPGDARDTSADIGKANDLLDYAPKVTLSEGLAKQVDWATRPAQGVYSS